MSRYKERDVATLDDEVRPVKASPSVREIDMHDHPTMSSSTSRMQPTSRASWLRNTAGPVQRTVPRG